MSFNYRIACASKVSAVCPVNRGNFYCDGKSMRRGNTGTLSPLSGGANTDSEQCVGIFEGLKSDEPAHTAVNCLRYFIKQKNPDDIDYIKQLTDYFKACDRVIAGLESTEPNDVSMAVVFLRYNGLYFTSAGDTLVYIMRGGEVTLLDPPEYALRAVGAAGAFDPQPIFGELAAGDRIIICTSGMKRSISNAKLEEILASAPTAEDCADQLCSEAMSHGIADSVTVAVIDVDEETSEGYWMLPALVPGLVEEEIPADEAPAAEEEKFTSDPNEKTIEVSSGMIANQPFNDAAEEVPADGPAEEPTAPYDPEATAAATAVYSSIFSDRHPVPEDDDEEYSPSRVQSAGFDDEYDPEEDEEEKRKKDENKKRALIVAVICAAVLLMGLLLAILVTSIGNASSKSTDTLPAGTSDPAETQTTGTETTADTTKETETETTAESTSDESTDESTDDTSESDSTSESEPADEPSGDPSGSLDGTTTSKGYGVSYRNGAYYVNANGNEILVANKTYALDSDYNPGGLTSATDYAFEKLKEAAAEDGCNIFLVSGFRSYSRQKQLYENYVARDGKAEADTYSARPGYSEHQSGLAIDVNSVDQSFENTKEGKWLAEHCQEYGFIIRYPKGKESVTGYIYEPWHIRYVGSIAPDIAASGLTLEEYLGIDSRYAD